MPVLPPVTIAKAQLPLFKQEANLCCELISKFTHSKQLRGNKALNLYSRLCGYVSYQALKVKSSGFDAAENKPIGCITQERFPFMIGVLMREPQFVSETVAEKVLINMQLRIALPDAPTAHPEDLAVLNHLTADATKESIDLVAQEHVAAAERKTSACGREDGETTYPFNIEPSTRKQLKTLSKHNKGLVVFVSPVGKGKRNVMAAWLKSDVLLVNRDVVVINEIRNDDDFSAAIKCAETKLAVATFTPPKDERGFDPFRELSEKNHGLFTITRVEIENNCPVSLKFHQQTSYGAPLIFDDTVANSATSFPCEIIYDENFDPEGCRRLEKAAEKCRSIGIER